MGIQFVVRPRKSEAGATMVEYGLVVAVIAIVVVVAVQFFGQQLYAYYQGWVASL